MNNHVDDNMTINFNINSVKLISLDADCDQISRISITNDS